MKRKRKMLQQAAPPTNPNIIQDRVAEYTPPNLKARTSPNPNEETNASSESNDGTPRAPGRQIQTVIQAPLKLRAYTTTENQA